MCTWAPSASNSSANQGIGAEPYPPPTSTARPARAAAGTGGQRPDDVQHVTDPPARHPGAADTVARRRRSRSCRPRPGAGRRPGAAASRSAPPPPPGPRTARAGPLGDRRGVDDQPPIGPGGFVGDHGRRPDLDGWFTGSLSTLTRPPAGGAQPGRMLLQRGHPYRFVARGLDRLHRGASCCTVVMIGASTAVVAARISYPSCRAAGPPACSPPSPPRRR